MGKFEVGNTASKGKGRPVGSRGKANKKITEAFAQLVENNIDKLQDDLDKLEPGERIKHIIALSNFLIPKIKQSEVIIDDIREQPIFNITLEKLIDVDDDKFEKALNE